MPIAPTVRRRASASASASASAPLAAASSCPDPAAAAAPVGRPGTGRRRMPRTAVAGLALLALAATGCRGHERTYPGQPIATVWTAARAAAESPDYDAAAVADRWIVDVNEVRVDEEAGELEIFRELSRLHLRSGGDRFTERRTWKLGVRVRPEDEMPVVSIVSRGLAVPAHVRDEADRYFAQIDALLDAPDTRPSPRAGGAAAAPGS